MNNVLKNKMTFGRKIGAFFAYLQNGGELVIDGYTYVWCDNHITKTEMDDSGNEIHFGIDGLAVKADRVNVQGDVIGEHYFGQNDMPFYQLQNLVDNLSEEQLFQITASAALLKSVKQR